MIETPFDILYEKLWRIFADDVEFNAIVKPGNLIRYDDKRDRDPHNTTHATSSDFPEVGLLPQGFDFHIRATTTSCILQRTYQIAINNGDFRLTAGVTAIEWRAFCLLTKRRAEILNLEYKGEKFVHDIVTETATVGQGDVFPRQTRIAGWVSLLPITCSLNFRTKFITENE